VEIPLAGHDPQLRDCHDKAGFIAHSIQSLALGSSFRNDNDGFEFPG